MTLRRKTTVLPMLAALAVLTAGTARRALAAQVDPVTPRAQHGLTLLSVVRGDEHGEYKFPVPAGMEFLAGPRASGFPGGVGLWVRGPKPPPALRPRPGGRQSFVAYRSPQATARAVGGDALPVQAQRAFGNGMDSSGGTTPPPLYLISLPGGYPPSLKAVDVSVGDGQGHNARWRVTHLPPSFHAVAGTPVPRSVFRGAGVTLSVRAWRDLGGAFASRDPSMAAQQRSVRYRIQAQVPPGTGWTVRIRRQQLEWEALPPSAPPPMGNVPPQYAARAAAMRRVSSVFSAGFGTAAPPVRGGFGGAGMAQGYVPAPFAAANHFLRLQGELVRTASAQESVTFRSLTVHARKPSVPSPYGSHYTPPPVYVMDAAPQTQTTPSGLSVSLLPPPNSPQYGFGFGGPDGVRLFLKFSPAPPGPLPISLPRSSLARKYHKPISYFLRAQPPYFLEVLPFFGGFMSPGAAAGGQLAILRTPFAPPIRTVRDGRMVFLPAPPALPKRLDHLTLTVVQRAELRSIPISFLVPIGNSPPPPSRPARFFPGRFPPGFRPPPRRP